MCTLGKEDALKLYSKSKSYASLTIQSHCRFANHRHSARLAVVHCHQRCNCKTPSGRNYSKSSTDPSTKIRSLLQGHSAGKKNLLGDYSICKMCFLVECLTIRRNPRKDLHFGHQHTRELGNLGLQGVSGKISLLKKIIHC